MAEGRRIWDIDPVPSLGGSEKVPLGKGGESASVATINQTKEFINREISQSLRNIEAKIGDGGINVMSEAEFDSRLSEGNLPDGIYGTY